MQYIDLHVHSTCSDGTFTPEQIVDLAVDKGLAAFALTDHDTVAGVGRALAAARGKSLTVIPGVELSCEYTVTPSRKKEIHILGYQLDHENKVLIERLQEAADERDKRIDLYAFPTDPKLRQKKQKHNEKQNRDNGGPYCSPHGKNLAVGIRRRSICGIRRKILYSPRRRLSTENATLSAISEKRKRSRNARSDPLGAIPRKSYLLC